MAIDADKSFEVSEDGLKIDSGTGIWVGGGDAVPTHVSPEGSQYYRTSPAETYVQAGPGDGTNWILFEGGGDGKATCEDFAQTSHGLAVGDVVRYASGAWVKAQADTAVNSEAIAIVSEVPDVNNLTVCYSGRVDGLSGLTADCVYFLDDSTAGAITLTEPTISKPILFATSTTSAVVNVLRALETDTAAEADKVYRMGHTYAICGEIKVPSGDDDFIPPFFFSLTTGQTAKLVKARHVINSGTSVTCKLQKNGADITGFTGVSVTTTAADTDPADVTLADNDKLALVVTAVAGVPKNLSFTLFIEVTQ